MTGVARDTSGGTLGGLLVKVDSVNPQGYSYYSNAVVTAADGRFELEVRRLPPLLVVPPDNDVVTVDIKAKSAAHTGDWSDPQARAQVTLRFVGLDSIVEPIEVVVQFAIP